MLKSMKEKKRESRDIAHVSKTSKEKRESYAKRSSSSIPIYTHAHLDQVV
jgi:hypothetical protein